MLRHILYPDMHAMMSGQLDAVALVLAASGHCRCRCVRPHHVYLLMPQVLLQAMCSRCIGA